MATEALEQQIGELFEKSQRSLGNHPFLLKRLIEISKMQDKGFLSTFWYHTEIVMAAPLGKSTARVFQFILAFVLSQHSLRLENQEVQILVVILFHS